MTPDQNPQPESDQSSAAEPSTQNNRSGAEDSSVPPTVNVEARPVTDSPSASTPIVDTPASKAKADSTTAPKAKTETPATSQSEGPTAMDQAKEVARVMWEQAKPILQKVGTQALILGNRFTDFFLDKAVPTTTEKFIQVLPTDFKTSVKEKVDPVQSKVMPIWQTVKPQIAKILGPLWAKLLAALRQRLPEDLSGQLSDRFLNVAIVTTLVVIWWFFSSLTSPGQAKKPESNLTFPEVKNKPALTSPSPTMAPKAPTPLRPTPIPAPSASTAPRPLPKPAPSAIAPTAPVKPLPSPAVSPAPKPLPKPVPKAKTVPVQPEAAPKPAPIAVPVKEPIKTGPDLIALKAQMVQVSDRVLADGAAMVEKVSVDESGGRFVVQVSDRWYQLTNDEQTDFAQAMLSKAEKLDQGRLEVRDSKNERLARSPYIGDKMIILKR